jgi:hypothetical protein
MALGRCLLAAIMSDAMLHGELWIHGLFSETTSPGLGLILLASLVLLAADRFQGGPAKVERAQGGGLPIRLPPGPGRLRGRGPLGPCGQGLLPDRIGGAVLQRRKRPGHGQRHGPSHPSGGEPAGDHLQQPLPAGDLQREPGGQGPPYLRRRHRPLRRGVGITRAAIRRT